MYLPQHTTLCSKVNALQMTVQCMSILTMVTETWQIITSLVMHVGKQESKCVEVWLLHTQATVWAFILQDIVLHAIS